MNLQYKHLILCIRTKVQKEIHLRVWANRRRQYLKQSHNLYFDFHHTDNMLRNSQITD